MFGNGCDSKLTPLFTGNPLLWRLSRGMEGGHGEHGIENMTVLKSNERGLIHVELPGGGEGLAHVRRPFMHETELEKRIEFGSVGSMIGPVRVGSKVHDRGRRHSPGGSSIVT